MTISDGTEPSRIDDGEGGLQQSVTASRPASAGDDAADLLRKAELVLIDLDGCLAFEQEPHPAATRLLAMLESRYVVLSNNSTETPEGLAAALAERGLAVDPQRIVLAGALMIDVLADSSPDRPVSLFAAPRLTEYAAQKGLVLAGRDDDGASIVALARDTTLTYAKLNQIIGRLSEGAELVVSNPDITHPGVNRVPVVETGALLAAVRACVPNAVTRIIGKPEPMMFETALRRFGVVASAAMMIGDNPDTDGLGAERAGIPSVLVGPGGRYASIGDLV